MGESNSAAWPKRRRGPRYDLWMRHPNVDGGVMQQISDEHHSQELREGFLECYLAAGWVDPELRPVTVDDRLLLAEVSRLRIRVAKLEALCNDR